MPGLTFTPVSATSLANAVSPAPQTVAGGDFSSFRQVHDQETSRMNDYSAFDGSSHWPAANPSSDVSTPAPTPATGQDPSGAGDASRADSGNTSNTPNSQSAKAGNDTERSAHDSGDDSQSSDDSQTTSSTKASTQPHKDGKTDKSDSHHKAAKNKGDKKHDGKSSDHADASAVASSSQPSKPAPAALSLNIALNAQAAKAATGDKTGDSTSKGDAAKKGQSIAAELKVGDGSANGDGKKEAGKADLSNLLKTATADSKAGNAKSASSQTSRFFQHLQASGGETSSTTGDNASSTQSAPGAQQTSSASGAQSAAAKTANASALNQYTTSVNVPVGQAAWGDQIAGKIAWLTHQGMQTADIHLNPAELGPIQVQVQMHNDQANIVMHTHHAGVRDLLEANGGKLRDMLQNNGVGLGSLNVSTQSGQQQNGQQSHESGSGSRGSSTGGIASVSGAGVDMEPVSSGTVHLAWRGEVDLYA